MIWKAVFWIVVLLGIEELLIVLRMLGMIEKPAFWVSSIIVFLFLLSATAAWKDNKDLDKALERLTR